MTDSPQSTFYRGLERTQNALRRISNRAPADAARAAHAVVDELVAAGEGAETRVCAAGCSYCCYFPVGATTAEIEALVHALRQRLPVDALDLLAKRIATRAADVAPLSWKDQAGAAQPCVLLGAEQQCSVYEARPIACRGWSSFSVQSCEQHHSRTGSPDADTEAYYLALGAHAALVGACADNETYDLASGLMRALEHRPGERLNLSGCRRAGR